MVMSVFTYLGEFAIAIADGILTYYLLVWAGFPHGFFPAAIALVVFGVGLSLALARQHQRPTGSASAI